jgi:hypothetical protein
MSFSYGKGILLLALVPFFCFAKQPSFSGTWNIDLRSTEERKLHFECGAATFELAQVGDKVSGNHYMSTPQCGRINEGGEGTVKGIAVGNTAILVVTSGRNGAIVLGRAKLKGDTLQWETTEEIRGGDPEGDSPLILSKGTLIRLRN